jgi:hypothetical protein
VVSRRERVELGSHLGDDFVSVGGAGVPAEGVLDELRSGEGEEPLPEAGHQPARSVHPPQPWLDRRTVSASDPPSAAGNQPEEPSIARGTLVMLATSARTCLLISGVIKTMSPRGCRSRVNVTSVVSAATS